jgi:hypothetical protein
MSRHSFFFLLILRFSIAAAAIFFYGCKSDGPIQKDAFGKSVRLKGRTLISSNELTDPWVILNMDSNIFIANYKGSPVLEVYSVQGKKIKSLIERGSKKNDIAMVGSLQSDPNHYLLYLYDLFEKKILGISVNDLTKNKNVDPELLIDFKTWQTQSDNLGKAYVLDSCFLFENYTPEGRLIFFSPKGQSLGKKLSFPKTDSSLSDMENARLYAGQITTSPKKDKLAMITYNAGMINLFDLKNKELIPVWSDTSFLAADWKKLQVANTTRIAFTPESTAGYLDICSTGDFVYALFSGKKLKENYKFTNVIQVVSWDGKKKIQLILDRMIKRLTVSQDNTHIFGIASNEKDEPEIVAFDIQNILN